MLSFKPSVTLTRGLYDRARTQAEKAGYSSVDEFVCHVLERELAKSQEADVRDDVERKLKGLGYLK
ncbi:MAG TPA: hypothetical protein VEX68_05085 [Bryobacteraceae bacterium]|nr:hypothetical protein [Bryobacteraceae bacterium]